LKILFIGDVVGGPGRRILEKRLRSLQHEHDIDFTVANGENAAGGAGINKKAYQELLDSGVDAFTMGNHVWDNKDIFSFIDQGAKIVRPANLPASSPGIGCAVFEAGGFSVALINILGRVYMPGVDCPFLTADHLLKTLSPPTPYVVVDIHAEATSEKVTMGWYLDGRVSAVIGTHTHVQTNDARILPKGTAYITDVGMTGPRDSVLGVDKDAVIRRFVTHLPTRFEPAAGDLQFNGVILDLDSGGRCRSMETINFMEPSF